MIDLLLIAWEGWLWISRKNLMLLLPRGMFTPPSLLTNPSPQIAGLRSSLDNQSSCEQEIIRKGIEQLEKQVLQFINVFIPQNQSNITVLKKCKTVYVPAVNSAIGNIQKALWKYVGFSGIDPVFCDGIGELIDRAQAWCLDIEELYNEVEFHSINTSKWYASDLGVLLTMLK